MSAIKLSLAGVLLGLIAVLAGCSHEPPVAVPPPLEVIVSQPVKEKIKDWDVYTGTLQSKESVEVRSRVNGHIKEVRFTEGDEVAAGAELFLIDSAPFEAELKKAQGELATWKAKLNFAGEKIALYKPLAERGTVSREEMLQAVSAKGEAIGGIDTAEGRIREAQLNIGYCKIRADVAGKTGLALLTKGDLAASAGPQSHLTTIVPVDPLYVYFNVNENAFLNYQAILRDRAAAGTGVETDKNGKPVIPVEMALVVDTGFPYKGVIDFLDNQVDQATGSVKVRARFENPKGPDGSRRLSAGLFARVRISIADAHAAMLIVDRAKLSDQTLKYVLVVNKAKGNVVERRDITASDRVQDDGLCAVEGGLQGDEWVIVEGVNRVREGTVVNPKDTPMPRRPIGAKK